MQALLTELARIRQHGLTEQEITAARLQQMSEAESMYRERNQIYSTVSLPFSSPPFDPLCMLQISLLMVLSRNMRFGQP